jgi:CRP-like cAMP-binding protein
MLFKVRRSQQLLQSDRSKTFTERSIQKNEYFLREGKISDEYLYLEEGIMRAFAIDHEGRDVTTGFYVSNQVVFEVASFFKRTRSAENIVAITDCKGWSISFDQLNHLFHSMPHFREFGRAMLVNGFASLKERMLGVITLSAEERYTALLETKPELINHVPLKHLATYLGITDTSLSRIRKEISKK